jgi:hypothetical protein
MKQRKLKQDHVKIINQEKELVESIFSYFGINQKA